MSQLLNEEQTREYLAECFNKADKETQEQVIQNLSEVFIDVLLDYFKVPAQQPANPSN